MNPKEQLTQHNKLELCIDFFNEYLLLAITKETAWDIEYKEINERVCHIIWVKK